MRFLKLNLLAAGVLIAAACYKTEDPAAPIVNFSVTPSPATVDVRVDSVVPTPLAVVVKDGGGATIDAAAGLHFVPDDATIANVYYQAATDEYFIYGRQAGTTRIRVTYGATSTPGYITVTVRPRPVVTVDLQPPTATLVTGGTQQFTATLLAGPGDTVKTVRSPSGAAIVTRTATYSIAAGDGSKATVSATGRVTAVAPGTARVIATYKNTTKAATFTNADTATVADTSVVTITQAAAATFTVTPASATLAPKGSIALRYTCRAANGSVTTCATPTAVSSNPAVATVGLIDPVAQTITVNASTVAGTSGDATITITSGALVTTALIAVR